MAVYQNHCWECWTFSKTAIRDIKVFIWFLYVMEITKKGKSFIPKPETISYFYDVKKINTTTVLNTTIRSRKTIHWRHALTLTC